MNEQGRWAGQSRQDLGRHQGSVVLIDGKDVDAFAAIGVSMFMHANGKREDGLFVGQWVAPLLLFGVYNKLVKVAGSDRTAQM